MNFDTVVLVNLAASLFMTGLVVFVQIVHYPLLVRMPSSGLPEYEREHAERTTLIVMPVMLIELASAVALVLLAPDGLSRTSAYIAAALLAVIWISTFVLQVPAHRQLQTNPSLETVAKLVRTNWLRTVGWSLRSVLLITLVIKELKT